MGPSGKPGLTVTFTFAPDMADFSPTGLDPDDVPPCSAPISRDDLLDWHEQLASMDHLPAELDDER